MSQSKKRKWASIVLIATSVFIIWHSFRERPKQENSEAIQITKTIPLPPLPSDNN